MTDRIQHRWHHSECGYDTCSICMNCGVSDEQSSNGVFWYVTTKYCDEFESEKARYSRLLGTVEHFVVRNKNYEYLDRDYKFGPFSKAKLYARRAPATSALNNLVNNHDHNSEDLQVIKIIIHEPR